MAFGAELKDFVAGFQAGYKMIDSPEEKASKRAGKPVRRVTMTGKVNGTMKSGTIVVAAMISRIAGMMKARAGTSFVLDRNTNLN